MNDLELRSFPDLIEGQSPTESLSWGVRLLVVDPPYLTWTNFFALGALL
jgi:hypothetical protein